MAASSFRNGVPLSSSRLIEVSTPYSVGTTAVAQGCFGHLDLSGQLMAILT